MFILCLWLRIIGTSNQDVLFMNFPSKIFFSDINHCYRAASLKKKFLWLLPFRMVVATYFYHEKVRRTMRTAIVSNLLKSHYWEILTYSKLRFSKFKKFVSRLVFGELQLTQISLNFQTSCCNLKIRDLGVKLCVAFLLFFFL